MRKNPLVTTSQVVLMVVGSGLVYPYTFMPILETTPANQDIWIVLLLSAIYIIIINAPALFIMNKFRGLSASRKIEMILGKPMGKVVAVLYVLYFIFYSIDIMVINGMFIRTHLIPETPFWAITILMAIPAVYISYKGGGTIGRTASFLVSFLLVSVIFFFVFGIDKMNINEIKPILADSTFAQLNLGAFITAVRFSSIMILFVFSFHMSDKVHVIKVFGVILGVFIISFLLILLPTILVLGYVYARHLLSPYFIFVAQVEAFGFLTRVQSLFVLALFPVTAFKLGVYNYMAAHMFSDLAGTKTHKGFVIPFMIIPFAACMIPAMQKTSNLEVINSDHFLPFVIIPFILILPVFMLIVYLIRRKKINLAITSGPPEEDASK